jgi:hypothetical protein
MDKISRWSAVIFSPPRRSMEASDVERHSFRRIRLDRDNPCFTGWQAATVTQATTLEPHSNAPHRNQPPAGQSFISAPAPPCNASLILFTRFRRDEGAEQIHLCPRSVIFITSSPALAPRASPTDGCPFEAIFFWPIRQIRLWQSAIHWNL